MGATDRLGAGFRQTEVFDLARLDQVFHRPRHVFDRNVGIDAVLIQEINHLRLEPLEGFFDDLLDVLGPAVEAREICGEVEAVFRGDHHLIRKGASALPTTSSLVNGP